MNGSFWRTRAVWSCVALAAGSFFLNTTAVQAQTLPPVEYELHAICWPDGSPISGLSPRDISVDGIVVGYRNVGDSIRVAYLFEVPNETNPHGRYEELGDLIDLAPLEGEGWIKSHFLSINDFGAIVGMMEKADGSQRGILVDVSQTTPTWEWLPDMGSYRSSARAINDLGDIAFRVRRLDGTDDVYVYNSGMYAPELAFPAFGIGLTSGNVSLGQINNMRGVLVQEYNGVYYIYDIDTRSFSDPILLDREIAYLRGLNDFGQVVGAFADIPETGRGKNRTPRIPKVAIRVGTQPSPQLEWSDSLDGADKSDGTDINNLGVIVGFRSLPSRAFVFHDDWGSIDLSQLVTTQSWDYLQFTEPDLIGDGSTELSGFGVILGTGWYDLSTWAYDYVLIPKVLDLGDFQNYTSGDINLDIPDNDPQGVSHTVNVAAGDEVQIVGLTVTLDISHQRPGDLTVTMTGPNGTQVPLTNTNGENTVTAFNGISSLGNWTLTAVDHQKKKTGTIVRWLISAEY